MSGSFEIKDPLPGARFGAVVRLDRPLSEAMPEGLPQVLADAGGLLLIPGRYEIGPAPVLLVDLSRRFGSEVEDYRNLLIGRNMVHETQPEILLVTNTVPGARPPPALPDPPLTADGRLPIQYPHRRGWHSDQSYRRPPPDISLFYAAVPVDPSRGQTLFASGILAYKALPERLKARVEGLQGLHAQPGTGRGRKEALAGTPPRAFAPHERSQPQPVVRTHPVTGQPALYLCEYSQMDWFDGPFLGMQPGPHGDGAALLDELMAHYTRPDFVYVHEWNEGDLLVWDNRCLIHTATWYDPDKDRRLMWRTTVRGNPGPLYAGERPSWIPGEQVPAAGS